MFWNEPGVTLTLVWTGTWDVEDMTLVVVGPGTWGGFVTLVVVVIVLVVGTSVISCWMWGISNPITIMSSNSCICLFIAVTYSSSLDSSSFVLLYLITNSFSVCTAVDLAANLSWYLSSNSLGISCISVKQCPGTFQCDLDPPKERQVW